MNILFPVLVASMLHVAADESTATPPKTGPSFGIPAYWGITDDYESIPAGSLVVINPDNGVVRGSDGALEITSSAAAYRTIVKDLTDRGVIVHGYVPTGYFKHTCNIGGECQTWERIVTQIYAFFELYPSLNGIFFDEAAGADAECDDYKTEYATLSALVARYRPEAGVSFNPGMSNPCVIEAAQPGQTVLTFEGSLDRYSELSGYIHEAKKIAADRGVNTWHIVYSVDEKDLEKSYNQAIFHGVRYFYATNIGGNWQAGENTWGSPPKHWDKQLEILAH